MVHRKPRGSTFHPCNDRTRPRCPVGTVEGRRRRNHRDCLDRLLRMPGRYRRANLSSRGDNAIGRHLGRHGPRRLHHDRVGLGSADRSRVECGHARLLTSRWSRHYEWPPAAEPTALGGDHASRSMCPCPLMTLSRYLATECVDALTRRSSMQRPDPSGSLCISNLVAVMPARQLVEELCSRVRERGIERHPMSR